MGFECRSSPCLEACERFNGGCVEREVGVVEERNQKI
jgi:hypothetical protein